MHNSTTRFSARVQDYAKYRPTYPPEAIDYVIDHSGLAPGARIADIGFGTGISAKPFLERGFEVVGVEPNEAMREAGARLLSDFPNFRSIDGTAEDTGLDGDSIDLILAAQAFHWFDQTKAKSEFRRILRPGGKIALLWNERLTDVTPFLREYEDLIQRYATDYTQVDHRNISSERVAPFFAVPPAHTVFEHKQVFGFEGALGRLASCSYVISTDDPRYPALTEELRAIFERHQQNGTVEILNKTLVYVGEI